jgi:hypothetical protein
MKTMIIIVVSIMLSGCGWIFGPGDRAREAAWNAQLNAIAQGSGGYGGSSSDDIQGLINDNLATYQLQEMRRQSQSLLWMQMQGCR